MTDKEFAEQLQHEDIIKAHGYKKEECVACGGYGCGDRENKHINPNTGECLMCRGRGHHWVVAEGTLGALTGRTDAKELKG